MKRYVAAIVGIAFACLVVACGGAGGKGGVGAGSAASDDPNLHNLKSIQVERPDKPFTVRGECKLTTYFNYDFRNSKDTHYSVELSQDSPPASLHAYVERNSDDGRKMFELIGNGGSKTMTLECQFVGRKEVKIAQLVRVLAWE